MGGLMVVLAELTYTEPNAQTGYTPLRPAINIWSAGPGLLILGLLIFSAIKTISNGRIVMFVLGFLFPIFWIAGWLMGDKTD